MSSVMQLEVHMTARLNDRLSSVVFLASLAAVICFACLVFFVPHLEHLWKDSRQAMSALQVSLVEASHSRSNRRTAIILVAVLAASFAWRLVAAKRLRNSAA